ncbi:MAG: hypothetical protein IJ731_06150 [Eubacterium sp.]|nr:hypothetical protein [Eubacterium sp.]
MVNNIEKIRQMGFIAYVKKFKKVNGYVDDKDLSNAVTEMVGKYFSDSETDKNNFEIVIKTKDETNPNAPLDSDESNKEMFSVGIKSTNKVKIYTKENSHLEEVYENGNLVGLKRVFNDEKFQSLVSALSEYEETGFEDYQKTFIDLAINYLMGIENKGVTND